MCGRYALKTPPRALATIFDARVTPGLDGWGPRYNIAPTTSTPVVRLADSGRVLELMRWGLTPHWSKEPKTNYATFNARAEDAADKPAYRGPMRYRRCLVPADGFYEWNKRGQEKKARQQPFYIRPSDEKPFALAGLWDCWADELQTFTVLTTTPNTRMAELHDRMPVILPAEHHEHWLDPRVNDPQKLAPLLQPLPADHMIAQPVSRYVNRTDHDGPRCIEPIEEPARDCENASEDDASSRRPRGAKPSSDRSKDDAAAFEPGLFD